MLTSLQKTCICAETYIGLRTALFPRDYRYASCTSNWTGRAVEGGGYPQRWCHCTRAVGSGSGSAWLNEKLSDSYIRGHRGVLVMQNSHTNWISPGDASLSFMELSPARRAGRECLTWRLGIKVVPFARLVDEDLFLVALLRNGLR